MLEYELTSEAEDVIRNDITERLNSGEVGIIPTDTVYGLVCASGDETAKERIYELKDRPSDQPLQYLLSNVDQAKQLNIEVTPNLRKIADAFWPGALTVVIQDTEGVYQGIRIPKHGFIITLIEKLNRPLVATSANRHGVEPSESLDQSFMDLNGDPDFLVMEGDNKAPSSAVIKISSNDEVELIREGLITKETVEQIISA
ncbi:MAG: threonylcarbamoyl-AMP synthase [Lentisphaeria bacterium]|nr:L-threonylcarbamoyladenylate synthase [Lentisphaeria bacterium]NQZ69376.1 threonylcarbamoyl-AMP synthase [Lentisphaeria bacterium]